MALIEIAADIDALMAGDATERLEQAIAVSLFGGKRTVVAGKPTVEAAARRDQGPLVAGDRVEEARTVGTMAIRLNEISGKVRIGAQFLDDLAHSPTHGRALKRGFCL